MLIHHLSNTNALHTPTRNAVILSALFGKGHEIYVYECDVTILCKSSTTSSLAMGVAELCC